MKNSSLRRNFYPTLAWLGLLGATVMQLNAAQPSRLRSLPLEGPDTRFREDAPALAVPRDDEAPSLLRTEERPATELSLLRELPARTS